MDKKLSELLSGDTWKIKRLGEIFTFQKHNRNEEAGPTVEVRSLAGLRSIYFTNPTTCPQSSIYVGTFKRNSILIIGVDWSAKNIGRAFLYLGEEEHRHGCSIHVLETDQNTRYLIHFLNSSEFRCQIDKYLSKKYIRGVATGITPKDLASLEILMPSEETQTRIAQYLDELHRHHLDLEETLESELEDRRSQYEEFKSRLFSRGNWETKTMGDLAIDIFRGAEIRGEILNSEGQPIIKPKDLLERGDLFFVECRKYTAHVPPKTKKYCEYGDLLIVDQRGSFTYLGSGRCLVGSGGITIVKHGLNPKYLQYLWSSEIVRSQLNRYTTFRDPFPNREIISKIRIPVAPPEEQERIAQILDQYHSLMVELEENILQLIDSNREQHESYRNLVFSDRIKNPEKH